MAGKLYNLDDLRKPFTGEVDGVKGLVKLYREGNFLVTPTRTFSPPLSEEYDAPKRASKQDTNLWDILKACLAEHGIQYVHKYQRSGTCVGQGTAVSSDIAMSVAWLVGNYKFPGRTSVAASYAGGRVEAAGRPGSWQGSNGSWAAEWVTKWGVVTLREIGLPETSTVEDERLGLQWTRSRSGVPEQFETLAKLRPVVRAPLIKTVEEAAIAIESGSPIIDCSNLIPSGRTNADGVSAVRRSGGHCTTFSAVRYLRNGDMQIQYLNSWSDSWGNNGAVWITSVDAQRILNQNDSYAFVGINGLQPLERGLL